MKKKQKVTTISTREQLEERMGDLARVRHELDRLAAIMNRKILDIRAAYEATFAELDEDAARYLADLEAWAALHPSEFATRKSLDLLHGTIGYRTGQPALKPLKGVRWDDILTLLAHAQPGYVRTIAEPDKAAILADRDALGAEGLAALGLRVDQAERFYAEPKTDQAAG